MTSPKRIGFLSFGAWHPGGGSTHMAGDALRQTVELAVAAEQIGIDGAFVRIHHFARQLSSPFPLLTAIFQVVGQQLSVAATRTIVARIEERFGGRLPTPAELLATDPQVLRSAGLSTRKGATLRALAERFVDGRLSDGGLAAMTDDEVEAALTEVPGIGPWSAHGFLLVALDRPDVFLTGDIALRRAIQRIYGFDRIPSEAELVEISDRWRPYRSLAVSYLFASEYEEPR